MHTYIHTYARQTTRCRHTAGQDHHSCGFLCSAGCGSLAMLREEAQFLLPGRWRRTVVELDALPEDRHPGNAYQQQAHVAIAPKPAPPAVAVHPITAGEQSDPVRARLVKLCPAAATVSVWSNLSDHSGHARPSGMMVRRV